MSFADLVEKNKEQLFKADMNRFFRSVLTYMVDRKYRKTVRLTTWMKPQAEYPSETVEALADEIPNFKNDDAQMLAIFKHLEARKGKLKYVTDTNKWGYIEKWQTADQTAATLTGDCEDGAILLYVLARIKGITPDRMLIFAGNVENPYSKKKEGHAYLMYRPSVAPSYYVAMDWCYNPSRLSMKSREKFIVKDNDIYVQTPRGNGHTHIPHSIYKDVWWGFNEDYAIKDFRRKTRY